MPSFARPSIIPRDVLDRVALTRGEKLLASAQLTDGSWLLATASALYRAPHAEDGQQSWRREWTDVDLARFSGAERVLTIRWATGQGEEDYPLSPDVKRHFTRTVNERVTASVVASREIDVVGGKARIAVRRRADGELFSQVIMIGSADGSDPEVARKIDAVEASLRESAGMA